MTSKIACSLHCTITTFVTVKPKFSTVHCGVTVNTVTCSVINFLTQQFSSQSDPENCWLDVNCSSNVPTAEPRTYFFPVCLVYWFVLGFHVTFILDQWKAYSHS